MGSQVVVMRAFLNNSLRGIIERAFKFFQGNLPSNPRKIAIKLNLCSFKLPETGAVSHPYVVSKLLEFLKNSYRNAEIYLIEANCSSADADQLFHYLGFEELAHKYGAKCLNISKEPRVSRKIDGYFLKHIEIPRRLLDVDYFISHPKLKVHSYSKISCGLKNQFGCIPIRNRANYHKSLDEVIADVNLVYKPNFTLVDGIIAHSEMEPLVGVPNSSNILIASTDVVALDCACARVLGFHPRSVGHIVKAARKKIGSMSFESYGLRLKDLVFNKGFNRWKWRVLEIAQSLKGEQNG